MYEASLRNGELKWFILKVQSRFNFAAKSSKKVKFYGIDEAVTNLSLVVPVLEYFRMNLRVYS
jgi:hypothetical protein